MTCFKDQFAKSKPKGSSIEPISKQNFKNMMYMQHASVQLKSKLPIHNQMSQNFQKHDEFMNYNQDMDMHVAISMKTTSKC